MWLKYYFVINLYMQTISSIYTCRSSIQYYFIQYSYSGTPWPPLYNGQESGSQMNNLCTQPLNKGHPYIPYSGYITRVQQSKNLADPDPSNPKSRKSCKLKKRRGCQQNCPHIINYSLIRSKFIGYIRYSCLQLAVCRLLGITESWTLAPRTLIQTKDTSHSPFWIKAFRVIYTYILSHWSPIWS